MSVFIRYLAPLLGRAAVALLVGGLERLARRADSRGAREADAAAAPEPQAPSARAPDNGRSGARPPANPDNGGA